MNGLAIVPKRLVRLAVLVLLELLASCSPQSPQEIERLTAICLKHGLQSSVIQYVGETTDVFCVKQYGDRLVRWKADEIPEEMK